MSLPNCQIKKELLASNDNSARPDEDEDSRSKKRASVLDAAGAPKGRTSPKGDVSQSLHAPLFRCVRDRGAKPVSCQHR